MSTGFTSGKQLGYSCRDVTLKVLSFSVSCSDAAVASGILRVVCEIDRIGLHVNIWNARRARDDCVMRHRRGAQERVAFINAGRE